MFRDGESYRSFSHQFDRYYLFIAAYLLRQLRPAFREPAPTCAREVVREVRESARLPRFPARPRERNLLDPSRGNDNVRCFRDTLQHFRQPSDLAASRWSHRFSGLRSTRRFADFISLVPARGTCWTQIGRAHV